MRSVAIFRCAQSLSSNEVKDSRVNFADDVSELIPSEENVSDAEEEMVEELIQEAEIPDEADELKEPDVQGPANDKQ
ncbi:MAG: hypothetical protein ACE1ZS_09605 [Candidatus Poribacteria bacterium]